MEASLQHIKDLQYNPKLIIDIGAASGTLPLLNVFRSAKHLLVEPLKEFEPDLIELKKHFDLDYLICAVGNSSGEITINVHRDLYGSSILKEQDGAIADGIQRKIKVVSLDSLQQHTNIVDSIIIKVDVQGAELEVLRSGEDLLKKADIIIVECSFFRFQLNSSDVTDVIIYLKEKGFVMYEMFDFHNRPFDNALGQADILFVKEDGIFRKRHNWSTPEQRASIIENSYSS